MAGSTGDTEKRLAELKREVLRRGFDRHASTLNNVSELPGELQSPVVSALALREAIATIVMFPQQIQRGWHYVPKQALLFTATGVIHLLASIWPDQEPQVRCLQGCDLLYARITLILLYGSLEIVAQGQDAPTRLVLEFNTVDWYRLSLPLQRLLQATQVTPGDQDVRPLTIAARQAVEGLPLKFSNGLQIYGLLPGEILEEVLFQAATWKRWLYFLQKPLSADTMLLLTGNYLVIIREEIGVKQGWIISYIPRNNIVGIQNRPDGLLSELSVQLRRGGQVVDHELMLNSAAAVAWHKLWNRHGGQWEDLSEQP